MINQEKTPKKGILLGSLLGSSVGAGLMFLAILEGSWELSAVGLVMLLASYLYFKSMNPQFF